MTYFVATICKYETIRASYHSKYYLSNQGKSGTKFMEAITSFAFCISRGLLNKSHREMKNSNENKLRRSVKVCDT